jgi:serine/threonine protein kinase
MVLQYAKNGSLRKYLDNNFSNLKWKEKLNILYEIAFSLYNIHDNKYVHKDLHNGNILQFDYKYSMNGNTKITDLGLAQLISNSKTSNISNVCGVLLI